MPAVQQPGGRSSLDTSAAIASRFYNPASAIRNSQQSQLESSSRNDWRQIWEQEEDEGNGDGERNAAGSHERGEFN